MWNYLKTFRQNYVKQILPLFLFLVLRKELISNLFTLCLLIWFITPSGITTLPLWKMYLFYCYLSCSFLGLTISQVWALNLILRLYWTASVTNPIVYFLNLPLEDAVQTDTLYGLTCCIVSFKKSLSLVPNCRTYFCCVVSQRSRTILHHKRAEYGIPLYWHCKCRLISAHPILFWWALILWWANYAQVSPA